MLMIDLDLFLRFLKGLCHGNQLKSKNWRVLQTNVLCRTAIPKQIEILQFRFQNIKYNEFLYIVYNIGDIASSIRRGCKGNNCTFLDEMAKIGIADRISQQLLDQSLSAFQHK